MKQKQLHREDVLFHHGLVQGGVTLVVRSVNAGPMLEREAVQAEGMLEATNAESRWCVYKSFHFSVCLKFFLKMLGVKPILRKNIYV